MSIATAAQVTLEQRPGHAHADYVIAARREILDRIAVGAPDPALCQPLRHGFYVFALDDHHPRGPVGMLEGFLYHQAFRRLEDAPYAQAGDLSRFGSPSELFHVRSVHVAPEHRGDRRIFPRLTMAIAAICVELGARHFTAGTAADARDLLHLSSRAAACSARRWRAVPPSPRSHRTTPPTASRTRADCHVA
jgi:hypothetical protein